MPEQKQEGDMKQYNLLEWRQPVEIIPFPLARRIGRIREVADKLMHKTDRQTEYYISQVTGGLFSQLDRLGVPVDTQDQMVEDFMTAVCQELNRRSGFDGGGAA